MKDVASVLFSNIHQVQTHMAAIRSRLGRMGASSSAESPGITGKPPTQYQAGTQPFFPAELAYALRSAHTPSEQPPSGYDDIIDAAARKNGVDADLVNAVVRAESGFRSDAVSPAGAKGLMQLMPSTAAGLGVSDPFDPAQNVEAGTRYLKKQLDRFGSTELALAAYNAGPGNVVKHGGIPPFNETRNYVTKVMGYLDELRNSK